jgi:transcriptional regulator with XRE-family HTH domain
MPLTWSQLAAKAKVNPKQIEQIETGMRNPSFTTVIKVAGALELRALDELLGPLPLSVFSKDS